MRPEPVHLGLLSDAAESVVNPVAAIVALAALRLAVEPADEEHAYGHAEAAGIDVWTSVGVVVGVAAVAASGWERLDAIVAQAVAADTALDRASSLSRGRHAGG